MFIKETREKELRLLNESIHVSKQGFRFIKENLNSLEMDDDANDDMTEFDGNKSFDPTKYLSKKECAIWNRLSERKQRQFIDRALKEHSFQNSTQTIEEKIGKVFREENIQNELASTQAATLKKQSSLYPFGKKSSTNSKNFSEPLQKGQSLQENSFTSTQKQLQNTSSVHTKSVAENGGSSVINTAGTTTTTAGTTTASAGATGGASLAIQVGKKTADVFRESLTSRALAAQQAQQKIKEKETVGAFPKPVAYASAAITSAIASITAMAIQMVTSLFSVLLAVIASILPLIVVICTVVVVFLSILASISSTNGAGYDLPVFVTEDMMETFFETQEKDGIPVSSGVAQLITESGFGLYGPGGSSGEGLSQLAYEYKNLFGIKYFDSDSFASGAVDMTTGEEMNGNNIEIVAGFSVYPNYAACIKQRAWMLSREPYASHVSPYLNQNNGQYTHQQARAFIYGIRSAGWATSSAYVSRCVQLMEDYNLYQFDNMTFEEYKKGIHFGGGSYTGVVTPIMQEIVNVAQSNTGTYPCTPDMCAAWVTGVYQAAGVQTVPYGDAIDMWNTYKNTGSTSMENIPPGAIVCGSGSGYMGSLYGHVGIYLGNGMVANNKGYHSLETLEEWCAWQTAVCQGNQGWIGWVYPGGVPTE